MTPITTEEAKKLLEDAKTFPVGNSGYDRISRLVQSYLEAAERLQGVLNSDVITTSQFNDYSESISKAREFLGRMR